MPAMRSRHYSVEKIGEGIHAAIARPSGYSICNSGLVDLDGGSLVFDTGLTPDSAQDLKTVASKALGHAPSLAAISHWHLDHSVGCQEFSSVPIWGTTRTREILLENRDRLLAELTPEELRKAIKELEALRAAARSDAARDDADLFLRINRALLAAAGKVKLTPPDHTFDHRLPLPGKRGADLISFGKGHTDADALLFLPHEKVVFTGDLVCVGVQPSMGSGDPDHWLIVLDEIERLAPERVVPGHGPVTNVEGIEETRAYVSGVIDAAEARPGETLPPAIRRWEGSMSLEENLKYVRARRAARDQG